jgi:uncharacterized protein
LHKDFVVIEETKIDLTGYTVIEGFPGMGLAGTIAAKYIVEKMPFIEFAHIESEVFMPIVRIHKGMPVNPARVYVNKKNKLVILIAEQVIPKEHTGHVAHAVVDWISSKKISRVISLAGLNTNDPSSDQVYGIAASEKARKSLVKAKVNVIGDGITTGLTALMLLQLTRKPSIEAYSLLGNVRVGADYKAAASLIKKLDEMIGLSIPVKPLLEEAKQTEKELLKQMTEMKKGTTEITKMENQTPMYT